MRIIEKDIESLMPYDRNPRKNNDAVAAVANSIREFGFKVPIIVDSNGVIVAGHTRYKAAQKLKMKKVPCIVADDLTTEQIKAFRLADNKVGELATWDDGLLQIELADLVDCFDMSGFGFDIDEDDEPSDEVTEEEKGNERERTMEAYNLYDFDENRAEGFYQMPIIHAVDYVPKELIGFNYLLTSEPKEGLGIHFYIDDYQFERVWNDPEKYIPKLAKYDCVLTPDFSLYREMPVAMKVWNVYRSRLVGQLLEDEGATVIPTLSWCEPETFKFCFDGLEQGGTYSISTIGVKREEAAFQIWKDGVDEAMRKLKPVRIVCYGGDVGYDFPCEVIYVNNTTTERMKKNGR